MKREKPPFTVYRVVWYGVRPQYEMGRVERYAGSWWVVRLHDGTEERSNGAGTWSRSIEGAVVTAATRIMFLHESRGSDYFVPMAKLIRFAMREQIEVGKILGAATQVERAEPVGR